MQANALRDGILTHHSSYQLIISSSIDIPSGSINTFIVKWHEDAKILLHSQKSTCWDTIKNEGAHPTVYHHLGAIQRKTYNQSYRDIAIDNEAWRSPHHMCRLCPNKEIEDQDHLTMKHR